MKKYFLPAGYFNGTYFNSLGNEIELPDGVKKALSDSAAKLEQFNCFTPEGAQDFSVSMQISLIVPFGYGLKETQQYKQGYTISPEFEGYNSVTFYSLTDELFNYFNSLGNSFVFQYRLEDGQIGVYLKNEKTGTISYLAEVEILSYF